MCVYFFPSLPSRHHRNPFFFSLSLRPPPTLTFSHPSTRDRRNGHDTTTTTTTATVRRFVAVTAAPPIPPTKQPPRGGLCVRPGFLSRKTRAAAPPTPRAAPPPAVRDYRGGGSGGGVLCACACGGGNILIDRTAAAAAALDRWAGGGARARRTVTATAANNLTAQCTHSHHDRARRFAANPSTKKCPATRRASARKEIAPAEGRATGVRRSAQSSPAPRARYNKCVVEVRARSDDAFYRPEAYIIVGGVFFAAVVTTVTRLRTRPAFRPSVRTTRFLNRRFSRSRDRLRRAYYYVTRTLPQPPHPTVTPSASLWVNARADAGEIIYLVKFSTSSGVRIIIIKKIYPGINTIRTILFVLNVSGKNSI